jgi:hypothetical protein
MKYLICENKDQLVHDIILLAGHEHFGYKRSEDTLSYYWCHFKIPNDDYAVTTVINMGVGNPPGFYHFSAAS